MLLSGCGGEVDGLQAGGAGGGGAPGTGGAPATGGGGSGGSGACPGSAGPAMVRVADGFCIDSTEVTNAQFADFLAEQGRDTSGQNLWCEWNTSYTPSDEWPSTADNHPVVFVDWCDGFAFCKWSGKRLCGKVGGGPNALGDYDDASKSQWYAVCSAQGTQTFPYGDTYDPGACNGADYAAADDEKIEVGSARGCVGGSPGVHDMSGNVLEWEDSCGSGTGGGSDDRCGSRGGTYLATETTLVCAYQELVFGTTSERNLTNKTVGFRCCAD